MNRRELFAWIVVACFLLIGAASISSVVTNVVATISGSVVLDPASFPISVFAHINNSKFPLHVVAHIVGSASGNQVAVNTSGQLSVLAALVSNQNLQALSHIASVTHVSVVPPSIGYTGQRCHSQAAFVTDGIEGMILHAGNTQRLYICGITIMPADNALPDNFVLVEGTTASCKTGTTGVYPGASAPHLGSKIHADAGVQIMRDTSWLSTQVAGQPLCFLKGSTSRYTGTITYGAY
jgi:hypothetical protein